MVHIFPCKKIELARQIKQTITVLNIVLLYFSTMYCTGSCDPAATGRHTGKLICQCNCNKVYWKFFWQEFLFFSRLKGDLFLNFCACHKKTYNQENISFVKGKHMYAFIKGIIVKTNFYCMHSSFLICTVPHPDVLWYHLNSMGTQKKKPKKNLTLFLSISRKNSLKYSLWILKNKNIFKRHKYPSPNALNIK